MIAAFVVSALFLTSYLTYHYHAGSTPFEGEGWIRGIYFAVLIPHIVLAALILPLALGTLYFAIRKQFAKHRRLARWTLPIWLYVSVTGVICTGCSTTSNNHSPALHPALPFSRFPASRSSTLAFLLKSSPTL